MSTTPAPVTVTATETVNSGLVDSSSSASSCLPPPPPSATVASSGATRPRASLVNKASPSIRSTAGPGSGGDGNGSSSIINFSSSNNGPAHLKSTTPIPIPVIPPISASTNTSISAPAKGPAQIALAPSFPAQTSSTSVFGVIQPPSNSQLQDIRHGHFRDGRIRNPIPSRLKGKTDGKSGKFIVMHMEIDNKQEAKDRDAAAKRTSEGTVQAARKAQAEGYRAVRRRFAPIEGLSIVPGHAQPTPTPSYPRPRPSRPHVPRAGPLTSEETKEEQVRLLPLLRSLNPTQVVERLCSAITFFGGTPGSMPPGDGVFPPSAEGNGQGSLFIGWVSEIFPPLDPNAPRPRGGVVVNGMVRRPRGRPRGSKTKNKGITALKNAKRKEPSGERPEDEGGYHHDDSWVDIDGPALGGDGGAGGDETAETLAAIEAASKSMQHTTTGQPRNVGQLAEPHLAAASRPTSARATQETPRPAIATTIVTPAAATTAETGASPAGRRRGRPKGSKNKPKGDRYEATARPGATREMGSASGAIAAPQTSQSSQAGLQAAQSAVLEQPFTPSRHGPGRPRGSRTKTKTASRPSESMVESARTTATPAGETDILLTSSQQVSSQDLSVIDNRTPLPSFASPETNGAQEAANSSSGRAPAGGSKRKRPSKTGVAASAATSNDIETGLDILTAQPPSKRVRRPKDSRLAPTSSAVSIATSGQTEGSNLQPHTTGELAGGHTVGVPDEMPDPVHALANASVSEKLGAGIGDARQQTRNNPSRHGSNPSQHQRSSLSPRISQSIPKAQKLASTLEVSQSLQTAAATTSKSSRNTGEGYFGNARSVFAAAQLNSQQYDQSRNQHQPQQQQQQQQQGHTSAVPSMPSNGNANRPSPQFGTAAATPEASPEGPHNSAAAFRAVAAPMTGLGKHNVSAYQQNTRRGPSVSPSDVGGFRNAAGPGPQSVPGSHHNSATTFSNHQATSGPAGVSSFGSFADPNFLDISNLESSGGLGMTANSYGMSANGSQRAANSAAYNLWRSSQG